MGLPLVNVVVIGGSAAGMAAAAKAKRTDSTLNLIVFEKSRYVSYAPCGIPYYFEGLVKSFDDLVYYTASYFREKRNINVHEKHSVTNVDLLRKRVTAINLDTNREIEVDFDKLVLATGGEPIRPPVDGIDKKGIYTLRTLEDGINFYKAATESKSIGIVGGGYIGLEMAEGLRSMGKKVVMFETLDHVMPSMDKEATVPIEKELRNNGVELHLQEEVKAFEGGNKIEKIVTDKGSYKINAVLLAVGVRPNVFLAKKLGLDLGVTKAIKVDSHMRTSDPDIYAAGDNVETTNLVTNKPTYAPLAPAANKMGRTAGENIAGGDTTFPGVVGTAFTKLFDLHIGRTGLSLAEAKKFGFDAVAVDITHGTRSHYYPKNKQLKIRLVADRMTHRILGGQIVGSEGVVGRINTLASVVTNHMTAEDLAMLDLGYAPPFAPIWDALTVAANAIQRNLK